ACKPDGISCQPNPRPSVKKPFCAGASRFVMPETSVSKIQKYPLLLLIPETLSVRVAFAAAALASEMAFLITATSFGPHFSSSGEPVSVASGVPTRMWKLTPARAASSTSSKNSTECAVTGTGEARAVTRSESSTADVGAMRCIVVVGKWGREE
ncbi:unnamed protein product, partial [Mycena citricolor]